MCQQFGGNVPQGLQLDVLDVLALVLGKAVQEERQILRPVGDEHAKPA
jgi:hypothetical protein